jgi:hypothetical protein
LGDEAKNHFGRISVAIGGNERPFEFALTGLLMSTIWDFRTSLSFRGDRNSLLTAHKKQKYPHEQIICFWVIWSDESRLKIVAFHAFGAQR